MLCDEGRQQSHFEEHAPQWLASFRSQRGEFWHGFSDSLNGSPYQGDSASHSLYACGWRHGEWLKSTHSGTSSTRQTVGTRRNEEGKARGKV
jgi:hypothetical protein